MEGEGEHARFGEKGKKSFSLIAFYFFNYLIKKKAIAYSLLDICQENKLLTCQMSQKCMPFMLGVNIHQCHVSFP